MAKKCNLIIFLILYIKVAPYPLGAKKSNGARCTQIGIHVPFLKP